MSQVIPEPKKVMRVGETRNEGVVIISRFPACFLVECSACGWKREYDQQAQADWFAFTHNRNFKKVGCNHG